LRSIILGMNVSEWAELRLTPSTLRSVRSHLRRCLAAVLLLLALIAGCGGGDDRESVEDLLDRAFRQSIRSADLNLEATLELKGEGAGDPVNLQASGPFRSNDGKLPSVDVTLRLGSGGGGQTVESGFLSTGDRAFVKFQDVYYEQPRAEVRKANEALAENRNGRQSSLAALGLDPRSWMSEAKDEGDEKVAGVDTHHVSGTLDVASMMHDLNKLVERGGAALGGATGQQAPEPLSDSDIRRITDVVKDPTFDIYVGKEDDTIRRVSGRIEADVPEDQRDGLNGLEGGTLTFSIEFEDVNGDQEIEAPSSARPLSDLTRSLGSGALEGITPVEPPADGGGNQGGEPAPDQDPGGSPDADDFRRYADCLDKARPEDTEALQRCAELLRP
jgi:hypothetical protein